MKKPKLSTHKRNFTNRKHVVRHKAAVAHRPVSYLTMRNNEIKKNENKPRGGYGVSEECKVSSWGYGIGRVDLIIEIDDYDMT